MATDPNGIVQPIREKAMPVMVMSSDDVDRWLQGGSLGRAADAEAGSHNAIVMRLEKQAAWRGAGSRRCKESVEA